MSNVIMLGDPHVGKSTSMGKVVLGTNLNSRIVDQVNILDWALEKAIEYHSHSIIITGDVFEEAKPHPSLITLFIAWLKKCQAYGVNVHIIRGNHDILRSGFIYTSALDIVDEIELDNVYIYKNINTIILGTTAFTLVPFRDRKSFSVPTNTEALTLLKESLTYELSSIPLTYQKVLVGHLAIEGSIPVGDEIDDITNELFCPLSMFAGYDYVWMGHVHKPQVMQKDPYIAHIGSMDISNFGEVDQKKIIVVFDCLSHHTWFEEKIPTRTIKKINIVVPKDTIDVTAHVLSELKKEDSLDKSIVRLDVALPSDALSIDKSVIEKFLISRGTFNINGITESKKQVVIKNDSNNLIDTKMDVMTSIKTYADKYIKDDIRARFVELATEIYTFYKTEEKDIADNQSILSSNRMKPLRLYIKDFMCYDTAFVDFTQFSAALIVGKTEGNDTEANGVGKTTLFKSIEYVLFNQSNFNLENIIRDNANACRVVFDFSIGNQEYRLSRSRTKKGSTDLSLYEKSTTVDLVDNIYHDDKNIPSFDDKYWKDISGRRAADTEKDLSKLLKIGFKSFRTFVHFVQHDFSSLATATPEKRKSILKDALNLITYPKLEKIAKDKAALFSREKDKCATIIDGLGNPDLDISKLQLQIASMQKNIDDIISNIGLTQSELDLVNSKITNLIARFSSLEIKLSALLAKEQSLLQDKNKLDISLKDYQSKKSILSQEARTLVSEIKQLEELCSKLSSNDFDQIAILTSSLEERKAFLAQCNFLMKDYLEKYEELKIPLPNDSICKHCRQPMTEQHRQDCLVKDQNRMEELRLLLQETKNSISKTNAFIADEQKSLNMLIAAKQQLEGNTLKLLSKKKEVSDKRNIYDDYLLLLETNTKELKEKEQDILSLQEEIKNSSGDELQRLRKQIQVEKDNGILISNKITSLNKELNNLSNQKAVLEHTLLQKNNDKQKKSSFNKLIKDLDAKLELYPLVIQAFSSTGIPNLVIHNVLDDLQVEINKLLSQFRPDLQLFFSVEKTKGDGTETDTLDIQYQVGGKNRYYDQLSGAMQLMVHFSLKLGLSFLLQNLMGIEIKLLLLDELDQPLSKGRVDAFVDIIKVLQKDFTILVITHNDRLKDKFSHAVLVEQDSEMISTAQVVSSW